MSSSGERTMVEEMEAQIEQIEDPGRREVFRQMLRTALANEARLSKRVPRERVTVTLPASVVREIDVFERNRSAFILEAVKTEIAKRKSALLRDSLLDAPSDTVALAEEGFDEWAAGLPAEDTSKLVDPTTGKPVRWIEGQGWVAGK